MAENDDLDEQLPRRLTEDLASLYAALRSVPSQVDDAILNRAHAQLLQSRRRRRTLRWAVTAVAAAACIAIAVRATLFNGSEPTAPTTPVAIQLQPQPVTILDALKLAREIQHGGGRDVNRDGQIDQRDVDALASAAVRLDAQGEVQ